MFVRGIGILCVAILALSVFATPSGATIWTCSASYQLDAAAAGAKAGDTIICTPGDYYPGHSYYFSVGNITLEGSTGNRDDVRIHGAGMNVNGGGLNNLIQFTVGGFTVKDLTIQDVNSNGIQIHGENGITSGNILNVHLLNIGERCIKGSGSTGQDANILVQNCLLEQTIARSGYAASGDLDYIGGIDTMNTTNWTVRNNVFKNIHGATGGGRGAVFIWNGTNATVEGNTFIGNDRSICFGNPSSTTGPNNSVIRNNFVVRGADIGVELCSTTNVKVYNNTIYSADATYGRTVSVYGQAGGPTTGLVGENNIIRGAVSQSGATWTSTNNIIDTTGATITSAWFTNAGTGDLHLTTAATAAINHGIALPTITTDFDGVARASSPDIGADERPLYPGDANKDASVDVVDLGILAKYYDTAGGATWAMGDFNNDTKVDVVDLGILAKNYDWTAPAGAVPEPASMSLLALATLALLRRKR